LARGDFARARQTVEQLRQRCEAGDLSGEEQQELSEQLSDLSAEIARAAEADRQWRDALREAGVREELSKLDGQTLREALKKAGLSDEEIDKLLEKMRACRQGRADAERLAQAMGQCKCARGRLSDAELAELARHLAQLAAAQRQADMTEATLARIDAAAAQLGQCAALQGAGDDETAGDEE